MTLIGRFSVVFLILNQASITFRLGQGIFEDQKAYRKEQEGKDDQCENIRRQIPDRCSLINRQFHGSDCISDWEKMGNKLKPFR